MLPVVVVDDDVIVGPVLVVASFVWRLVWSTEKVDVGSWDVFKVLISVLQGLNEFDMEPL